MEFKTLAKQLNFFLATPFGYIQWFKDQFNCAPDQTYHTIPVVEELQAFREDPLNNKEQLKIITFYEYLYWRIGKAKADKTFNDFMDEYHDWFWHRYGHYPVFVMPDGNSFLGYLLMRRKSSGLLVRDSAKLNILTPYEYMVHKYNTS